jgi:hypothetical protein
MGPAGDPVRRGPRSLATAAGAFAFFLSGCAGEAANLPADAPLEVSAAVDECSALGREAKTECYQAHFLARLADAGVREALSTLEAVAAVDVDVERDGHVYVHAIGITSYSPDVDVSSVFSECTTLFQSGCYHGVLQAHFMAVGEVTSDVVRELCQAYREPGADQWVLFQCLHGMGHGLTMFYGHHLPRALEGCDLLDARWDQQSCYGGAFMENIMNATNPHHPASELAAAVEEPAEAAGAGGEAAGAGGQAAEEGSEEAAEGEMHAHAEPGGHDAMAGAAAAEGEEAWEPWEALRNDDPHYPCSVMDRRYQRECYMMQTSAMLWMNGGDIGDAADSCDDAPEEWRPTCFQSLGRDISSYTLQDPDDSIRECGKANPEYRDWCYIGLVKNFVDLTSDTKTGFEFCRRVEEDSKPRCYEALGEEIGILGGTPEERWDMCQAAESLLYQQSCLYGARVQNTRPPGT